MDSECPDGRAKTMSEAMKVDIYEVINISVFLFIISVMNGGKVLHISFVV